MGREKEREKNIDVRETSISSLLYMPQLGTEPATQVCALTGNQTSNPFIAGQWPSNWATQVRAPPEASCVTHGKSLNFVSHISYLLSEGNNYIDPNW